MIHRAFRYKLAPTGEQEVLLRQFAGVVRLVYNLAKSILQPATR